MTRILKVALVLLAPAQLVSQSVDESRQVTASAIEYFQQRQSRGLPARLFENTLMRVDNILLGAEGAAKEAWIAQLASLSRARPLEGTVCASGQRVSDVLKRADCALKVGTYYLEVEPPTIQGDSATTRVHGSWLDSTERSALQYTALCLRLARRGTDWKVVRTCGVTSI